jgi:polyisoprenoid-binding protein YceI
MPRNPRADLDGPDSGRRRRGIPAKLIIAVVTALVLLPIAGAWFYANVLNDDQPEPLSLSTGVSAAPASTGAASTVAASSAPASSGEASAGSAAPAASAPESSSALSSAAPETSAAASVSTSAAPATSAAGADAPLDGTWTVGAGSIVGYRVKEQILGQDTEGVGRTSDVTGELTVAGGSVTATNFTADMTTVKSDKSQRDGQFRRRIMDTDTHPTATFVSSTPIVVPADASTGAQFTSTASGDLTLRGKTKTVTFDITGAKSATGFDVTAQIPIVFADFDIPNPSGGPANRGRRGHSRSAPEAGQEGIVGTHVCGVVSPPNRWVTTPQRLVSALVRTGGRCRRVLDRVLVAGPQRGVVGRRSVRAPAAAPGAGLRC